MVGLGWENTAEFHEGETDDMPLYGFHCERCDDDFELLLRHDEKGQCPHCKSKKIERLMSRIARPRSVGAAAVEDTSSYSSSSSSSDSAAAAAPPKGHGGGCDCC